MPQLETLWLYNNGFTGEIPARVADMTNLVSFDIVGNDMSGDIGVFASLPNVQVLHLGT